MRKTKRFILKVGYSLLKLYWFLFRPKTQGVRCLIIKDNSILLIQHSYGSSNWTVPGGGTKTGESIAESAKREISEEVGITVSELTKLGCVQYDEEYKKDSIYVFLTTVASEAFTIDELEISSAQWFPLDSLPDNSSKLLERFLFLYSPAK